MQNLESLYTPEKPKESLHLTLEEKQIVRSITLGIEEVDPVVREMAVDDVIATLENGHPLNRLITNQEGKTTGYIACEDFVPHEAYIKYLGTNKETGRNLLKEIPVFFEYAKQQGYTKLNFHGWNKRLNKILERYGFDHVGTDMMMDLPVNFYEKTLVQEKTTEQIEQERRDAFEQKYLTKLQQMYEQTLASYGKEGGEKSQKVSESFDNVGKRLETANIEYGKRQQAILKLKLARHFQTNDALDLNVLYDAIIETPKFINRDKGSLIRLLEVHEQKTLQKIAEIRKNRAEISGEESFNPYEALFMTESGNYYMARLLNMPHLEEESEYMDHCVGTSDSYISKMKRGDIEILSFRHAPQINQETNQLEGDTPLMTIEYNLKTNTIEQMKKYDDEYLSQDDPYYYDVINALKQLRTTETDTGKLRNFKQINQSELQDILVPQGHILTDEGQIHLAAFDPNNESFVLKIGEIPPIAELPLHARKNLIYLFEQGIVNEELAVDQNHLFLTTGEIVHFDEIDINVQSIDVYKSGELPSVSDLSLDNTQKLLYTFEKQKFELHEIAQTPNDINEHTKVYVGQLEPGIFNKIAEHNVEHIYTSFPEGKIIQEHVEIGGKTAEQLINELEAANIPVSFCAKSMLQNQEEFIPTTEPEDMELVRLTVADLGFTTSVRTDQIYARAQELGLELCPHDTGPHYVLQYQDQLTGQYFYIGMKQISITGYEHPYVFGVVNYENQDDGLWLMDSTARPDSPWQTWATRHEWCFRIHKSES